jgi:hypothetical protein
MRYQRAKIKEMDVFGKFYIDVIHKGFKDCPDTDIPHTVIEAFKHFPNEPVLIAGWAYRVID